MILLYIVGFCYLLSLIFLAPKIYFFILKLYAEFKLKGLGLDFSELEFSFEQIDYLVPVPSATFSEKSLAENEFLIKRLRKMPLWPEIYGLKVVVRIRNKDQQKSFEEIDLAFLNKNRFPVPILDMLKYYDEINELDYKLLVAYIFSHPKTHDMILTEVEKRLVQG